MHRRRTSCLFHPPLPLRRTLVCTLLRQGEQGSEVWPVAVPRLPQGRWRAFMAPARPALTHPAAASPRHSPGPHSWTAPHAQCSRRRPSCVPHCSYSNPRRDADCRRGRGGFEQLSRSAGLAQRAQQGRVSLYTKFVVCCNYSCSPQSREHAGSPPGVRRTSFAILRSARVSHVRMRKDISQSGCPAGLPPACLLSWWVPGA